MAKYQTERTFKVSWHGLDSYGSEIVEALNPYHAMEISSQDLVSNRELHTVPIFRELQELVASRGGAISVIQVL